MSDGKTTYALFIYGFAQMTWTAEVDLPVVWIGYAAGTDSFYSNIYSFKQQALRMDIHAEANGNTLLKYSNSYHSSFYLLY